MIQLLVINRPNNHLKCIQLQCTAEIKHTCTTYILHTTYKAVSPYHTLTC